MSTPIADLDTAVYGKLRAAAAVNIYPIFNTTPLSDAVPPWIVFQLVAETDEGRTFGKRAFTCLYLIKAVAEGRWPNTAIDIDSLIDTVLDGASLSIAGYDHLLCERASGFRLLELAQGKAYQHAGGYYRVWEAQQ